MFVETVLPAEIEGLELRQALPYLRPLPFPLLLLLALAALLVGLWAYRRYGRKEEEVREEPPRELTASRTLDASIRAMSVAISMPRAVSRASSTSAKPTAS